MSNPEKNKNHASKFPEHGPLDENGREILLSLKNIDITFGKGDDAVKAVTNASFDIHKGETFSLVGESGSGKTTIGRAVIRVLTHFQQERFITRVCLFQARFQNPLTVK